MSHDRGCYCGREKYEYDDCPRAGCPTNLGSARTEERIEFIVEQVRDTGMFRHRDLASKFHVTMAVSTNDMSIFRQRYPGAVEYRQHLHGYVITEKGRELLGPGLSRPEQIMKVLLDLTPAEKLEFDRLSKKVLG